MNARDRLRLPHSCGYLWAARAAAVILALFVLALAIGHGGLPSLAEQPWSVRVIFLGGAVVFAGYAIGWRAPAVGGWIGLAGLAVMNAGEWAANGRPLGGVFPLLAVPCVLYLIGAWLVRRHGPGCPVD
ncbi:MAG: hypothetical protein CMJ58_21200 [Planctomycetaceae bacterium]|nr:hypothetical protein [Planctomycetaceae bacterium]